LDCPRRKSNTSMNFKIFRNPRQKSDFLTLRVKFIQFRQTYSNFLTIKYQTKCIESIFSPTIGTKALMGRLFLLYLSSKRIYLCATCEVHLSTYDDIESKVRNVDFYADRPARPKVNQKQNSPLFWSVGVPGSTR
jgi:hypothetical protein